MLLYSKEEILNKNYVDITYPTDLERSDTEFNKLATGECNAYSVEKRYVHKKGHVLWGFLSVSAINVY